MSKKRISKVRQQRIEDFNRKRRNVMEKVGRISRQTGIERIQLENLIGFDRTLKADTIDTRELNKLNNKFDEITSRDFEPLKMRKMEHGLKIPNVAVEMIEQRIAEFEAFGDDLDFQWTDIEDTRDLGMFIEQLDDILGDFSQQGTAQDLMSTALKKDYMKLANEIATRYGVAETIALLLETMPDEDFMEAYDSGIVPPLFDVIWEDSEQINVWLDAMGEMLNNPFSANQAREPS